MPCVGVEVELLAGGGAAGLLIRIDVNSSDSEAGDETLSLQRMELTRYHSFALLVLRSKVVLGLVVVV